MLSIVITVCDKDYENCENLMKQITERVHIPKEVIVIDNREKYLEEKTSWKADFSFGYNAFQFSSRAKGIELAKGDYIWFVDGDDTIREIDEILFDNDIIVFSYNNYPEGDVHLEEAVYTKELFTWEMTEKVKPVLWNKFIKKSLFTKDFIDKYRDLKIHTLEDDIWLCEALRHADSIKVIDKVIYFHTEGISSKVGSVTFEQIKTLTTGLQDAMKVMKDMVNDEFYRKVALGQYTYIMQYVTKTEDVEESMDLLMDIIPKDDFKEILVYRTYAQCYSSRQLQRLVKSAQKRYGEIYAYPLATETLTWADGKVEEYTFPATIVFDESLKDVTLEQWRYSLSIVCLVYDGNVDYLYGFTKALMSNVKVKHEVIIVDNRADKTNRLVYYGEATIVKTEDNVGILDGRRAGFKASHNDYVWFVDIDDFILEVPDVDYGESDIIVFSHRYGDENSIISDNRIIPNEDFFTLETLYATNVVLWNKWFRRKTLEMSYKQIPHFFCVYSEDNLLYFSCLLFSKYIKLNATAPMYVHSTNDSSTTRRKLTDTKSVDLLFAGYDEAVAYMEQYFSFADKLTYLSPINILFYLEIMAKSDVKDYFAQKVLSLFGRERIQKALELAENYQDEKAKETILSISSYFM